MMNLRLSSLVRASALPFIFLVVMTTTGVNFGTYWDDDAMFAKVRHALTPPPTLLPYAYDYPQMTFWVSLAALAPEAARDPRLRNREPDTTALQEFTYTEAYRLRVRRLFATISALTVVWVAALSLTLGGSAWEAFAAASICAASWEVTYHTRWIAPDGMTTQFVAATIVCATAAVVASAQASRRWLLVATVAAALATATKYSAWVALVPVAVATWIRTPPPAPLTQRAWNVVRAGLFAVVAFVIVSPGTVLQPMLAVSWIVAQAQQYANGHSIYTVAAGWDHLSRLVAYCAGALLSPYAPVAVAMAAMALGGAVVLARNCQAAAAVLLSFPVLYITYFSFQRVMIVRNLIVIAPVAAVLAARGFAAAWDALAAARFVSISRGAAVAALVAVVGLDAAYDVSALESIRGRSERRTLAEFTQWFETQPAGAVKLSPHLRTALGAAPQPPRPDADVALYALDRGHEPIRPELGLFKRVFGPREVNLDYYPDWIGDDHIVVLSAAQAMRFGIALRETDSE